MARERRARPESNPFWTYSLRLYRQPGVAQACIALQDRSGVDVNVLLFCLWMGASGQTLTAAAARLVAGLSQAWSGNVVTPLRETRRFLKPLELPNLRNAVAAVELAAERVEQDLLLTVAPRRVTAPARPPAAAARRAAANVARYAKHWRRRPRGADIADVLRILTAAFPGSHLDELRAALR